TANAALLTNPALPPLPAVGPSNPVSPPSAARALPVLPVSAAPQPSPRALAVPPVGSASLVQTSELLSPVPPARSVPLERILPPDLETFAKVSRLVQRLEGAVTPGTLLDRPPADIELMTEFGSVSLPWAATFIKRIGDAKTPVRVEVRQDQKMPKYI